MRELCEIIKETVKPNFLNIRTSIRTYDRDAVLYGAPCWRWVYHALHSADKWFINPFDYAEPEFHTEGLDDPEKPCGRVLSDRELLDYLDRIEQKTYDYLDSLTDEDLKQANAYNTYQYRGLPPGPICSPSPAAIKAALYPDSAMVAEKYLYFCAKEPESGELYFARTLEEHERAVAVYAPLWKMYDQTRGLE